MKRKEIIIKIFLVIIVIYLFLLSIKLMGGSFKLFGKGFAESIIGFTDNLLVGLFIGILATALVQSSSVTTSLIVGLTAAGTLSVGSAIPVIMGANIGTSITNTIVSLGHITKRQEFRKAIAVATVHDFFNFIVVLILFPLELLFHPLEKASIFLTKLFLGTNMAVQFSSPLDIILKPVSKFIMALLESNPWIILCMALLMLFLSLRYFVKIIKPLAQTEFKHMLNNKIFRTPMRAFAFGIVLTIIVQSSSVSTSLIVPMAGAGLLALRKIFPYILGANIGTTFTSIMASLVAGSPAGLTVALGHLLFNTIGTVIIYPIRRIPIALSIMMANLSFKCRAYPLVYIGSIFYVLPFCVIWVSTL